MTIVSSSAPPGRRTSEVPGDSFGDQAEGLRVVRRGDRNNVVPLRRRGGGLRTIAVTSGKGGVGKTQLSANLGVELARRGLKVVLLDADLGLASLDLALGLRPHDDLRSVIRGTSRVEDIVVEGPHGVKLVPACPGRFDMANLTGAERQRLATAVSDYASDFDVLIIDTGAGIGSNAVAFASSADEVLLVCTPDPTALRDAYAMAKVLHRRSGVDRVRLVANQVGSDGEGRELHARLQDIVQRFMTLDLDYLGFIPRDDDVRLGVAAGEPYVVGSPHGAASRAIKMLGRRIAPPGGNDGREVAQ